MKIEYKPTDIVVPDQFFDRTRHRPDTFFGNGLVAHVSLAKPICPRLIDPFADAARAAGARVPTAAASTSTWRGRSSRPAPSPRSTASWGVDIIGMTNLQEARLAREAEICYATLSMVTDYDCWHETEEAVVGRGGDGGRAPERRRCPRRWCGEMLKRLPIERTGAAACARRSSTR